MDVYVDKHKCTGCQHCKDVCPVAVFEMKGRGTPENPDAEGANGDTAPEASKWKGQIDPAMEAKWANVTDNHKHFAKDNDGTSGGISVATAGSACILCQACLIECEGECIHITDDNGTLYDSIYK
ncbi:MAG TPA: ferredoxin [Candidatus Acidoferrales bacterium]|nr:ferredoxin [Candidatus Acidoferrales bacterium]